MTWTLVWKGKGIEVWDILLWLWNCQKFPEFVSYFSYFNRIFVGNSIGKSLVEFHGISNSKLAFNDFLLFQYWRVSWEILSIILEISTKEIPRFHVRYHFIKISVETKKKQIGNSLISWRHTFCELNNLYSWKTFSSHTSLTL